MEGAGDHCVVWNKTNTACFPHLQYLDALKYKLDNKIEDGLREQRY